MKGPDQAHATPSYQREAEKAVAMVELRVVFVTPAGLITNGTQTFRATVDGMTSLPSDKLAQEITNIAGEALCS